MTLTKGNRVRIPDCPAAVTDVNARRSKSECLSE